MMWDLKRVLKETCNLDKWRQRGEDILVRGNDVTRWWAYMPHKETVKRHFGQEMEFKLDLIA